MKHEFNSRIAAQRAILQAVNRPKRYVEDLFGLSAKAIDRWILVNSIDPKSLLVELVKDAGAKLFFLANKSQDQVSAEYQAISYELADICSAIAEELAATHVHVAR